MFSFSPFHLPNKNFYMKFSKFFTLLGLGTAFTASAQLPVDTSAQTRAVVIEEFTGVNCGYCPAGHKIASDIVAAYPAGKAFVINIHGGGFATPNSTQKDFRTADGNAIVADFSVTSFPAGTVNRTTSGGNLVYGRGSWTAQATSVAAMSSPVNLAAEATIDERTREISVVVEGYYTATSTATNKLYIALTQDSIMSPQSGASGNPTQVVGNSYRHMHALRKMLTGVSGKTISTTTAGTTFRDTIKWTIPHTIGDIDAVLEHMHAVAYVAEGRTNVFNGCNAPVTITPAGANATTVQASMTATAPATAGLCNTSYTPTVELENTGSNAITSYEVMYTLNSGTPVKQSYTTSLATGATSTITFPTITLAGGTNEIEFTYTLALANNNHILASGATINESLEVSVLDNPSTVLTTISENFESASYAFGQAAVNNVMAEGDMDFGVYNNPQQQSGGYGTSTDAFRFRFWTSPTNTTGSLTYNKVNLSNSTNTMLSFDVNKYHYAGSNDAFKVEASKDCGATWSTVYNKAGLALATDTTGGGASTTQGFGTYPAADDWRTDSVDLSAFDGEGEVVIRFTATSAYGDNLWLDNILVFEPTVSTALVLNKSNAAAINVFPNPVANEMTIELTNTADVDATVSVLNTMGQEVIALGNVALTEGVQSLNVNTSDLANGVYFVNIVSDNGTITKRFAVSK